MGDADREVAAVQPARVLVVGDRVPDSVSIARAARQRGADDVQLPLGLYLFDDGNHVEVMVVTQGAAAATPAQIAWTEDGHPLLSAYDWMGAWW